MRQSKSTTTLIVTQTSETRLSDARRWLRQETDLQDPRCELVLTELIANALEHGTGAVRVRATRSSDALDVHVTNPVDPSHITALPDTPVPGPEQRRGRGLYMIRQLAELDQRAVDGILSVHARVPIGR